MIKLVSEKSVTKLKIADPIRLNAEEVETFSSAFFAEIEAKLR